MVVASATLIPSVCTDGVRDRLDRIVACPTARLTEGPALPPWVSNELSLLGESLRLLPRSRWLERSPIGVLPISSRCSPRGNRVNESGLDQDREAQTEKEQGNKHVSATLHLSEHVSNEPLFRPAWRSVDSRPSSSPLIPSPRTRRGRSPQERPRTAFGPSRQKALTPANQPSWRLASEPDLPNREARESPQVARCVENENTTRRDCPPTKSS